MPVVIIANLYCKICKGKEPHVYCNDDSLMCLKCRLNGMITKTQMDDLIPESKGYATMPAQLDIIEVPAGRRKYVPDPRD